MCHCLVFDSRTGGSVMESSNDRGGPSNRPSGKEISSNQREASGRYKSHRSWPRFAAMRRSIFRKIPELKRGPVFALSMALGLVVILALVGYAIVTRAMAPDVQQQTNKPAVATPHSATAPPHS